jgi:hypothetical protein
VPPDQSALIKSAAIGDPRAQPLDRNITLAYDNFGAGEARLLESTRKRHQDGR